MKYIAKVYYKTPRMNEITRQLRQTRPDWAKSAKEVCTCKHFELDSDQPLDDAALKALKAKCEERIAVMNPHAQIIEVKIEVAVTGS